MQRLLCRTVGASGAGARALAPCARRALATSASPPPRRGSLLPAAAALPPRGSLAQPWPLLARRLSTAPRGTAAAAAAAAAPAAAAPAPAGPPETWRTYLSPKALFAKVKALGPTALGFYGALWVGPFLLAFAPIVLDVVVAPDPLVTIDHYLPAVGDGLRGTLGFLGVELPKPGEPLPKLLQGIVWGFLVNDLLEPPRLFLVLTLTPRIKEYLAGGKH
jgi:hypothetical protein